MNSNILWQVSVYPVEGIMWKKWLSMASKGLLREQDQGPGIILIV